jgi:uncharacterized membrane protein YphA (DoxX/SURF4 family)
MKAFKIYDWTRFTIHWAGFSYFLYIFGNASLSKVFKTPEMMAGMESFGFGEHWTLLIGYGELLGVAGLIAGFWYRPIKNAAVLWLFPFCVGALMVHFSHQDYQDHYDALFCCIASIMILVNDKMFKINL